MSGQYSVPMKRPTSIGYTIFEPMLDVLDIHKSIYYGCPLYVQIMYVHKWTSYGYPNDRHLQAIYGFYLDIQKISIGYPLICRHLLGECISNPTLHSLTALIRIYFSSSLFNFKKYTKLKF